MTLSIPPSSPLALADQVYLHWLELYLGFAHAMTALAIGVAVAAMLGVTLDKREAE